MKMVRANFVDVSDIAIGGTRAQGELHDVKFEGVGLVITITERVKEGTITVSIDPVGREFIDTVETSEFYVNRSQVRTVARGVKGVHGGR